MKSVSTRPYERYVSLDLLNAHLRRHPGIHEDHQALALVIQLMALLVEEELGRADRLHRQEHRLRRLAENLGAQIRLIEWFQGSGDAAIPPQVVAVLEQLSARVPTASGSLRALQSLALPAGAWLPEGAVKDMLPCPADGPEDTLFVVIHQVCECWLALALSRMTLVESAIASGGWSDAANALEDAARILGHLGRHVQLLETMILRDYHPLRVSLRGASGAQSVRVMEVHRRGQHLWRSFESLLEQSGLNLTSLLCEPSASPGLFALGEALSTFENRLCAFFFEHFQLARRVLGRDSLGSLGYEVSAMVDRFVKPMFPKLDQARFHHTMITNQAYAHRSGERITSLLGPLPEPSHIEPAPPENALDATLSNYFDAIRAMDCENWVRTFSADGTIADPHTSRPFVGHAELSTFFRGVQKLFKTLDVRPLARRLVGNTVEVEWQAEGQLYFGPTVSFQGTETFYFEPDGQLKHVRVSWNPQMVAEQMKAHLYARSRATS